MLSNIGTVMKTFEFCVYKKYYFICFVTLQYEFIKNLRFEMNNVTTPQGIKLFILIKYIKFTCNLSKNLIVGLHLLETDFQS